MQSELISVIHCANNDRLVRRRLENFIEDRVEVEEEFNAYRITKEVYKTMIKRIYKVELSFLESLKVKPGVALDRIDKLRTVK